MAGVYSVLRTARPAVYTGLLADLLTWGQIFKISDVIIPSDAVHTVYRGDGVSTFANLSPEGAIASPAPKAINTTAAGTSAVVLAAIKSGLITTTSAAAQTITLPTAVALVAALGAVRGTSIEFTVDNSAGANIVTVAIAAGITVAPAIITGSDTLTVAVGSVGVFRIYFKSVTAAFLSRIL